jgi:predicted regulator of Ras-like GTPase activity (Roadblock/LC7/MglB family)
VNDFGELETGAEDIDEEFALLLANDAEKNFGKMILATKKRRDRIAAVLKIAKVEKKRR